MATAKKRKPAKKAAKKRTTVGKGLKGYLAKVRKATATENRRIKVAEALIKKLKAAKAKKVKALRKKK